MTEHTCADLGVCQSRDDRQCEVCPRDALYYQGYPGGRPLWRWPTGAPAAEPAAPTNLIAPAPWNPKSSNR